MLLVQLCKRAKLDLECQLVFCENRVLNLYFNPPSELLGKYKCVPIVGVSNGHIQFESARKNLVFARIARKNNARARLLVLAKFL